MTDPGHGSDCQSWLEPELVAIADGVYGWVQPDGTWWVNNCGLVELDGEALVIDTCATADRTRRFLDAASAVLADQPIRFAVNTHQHGDHTYGNVLLPPSALLYGHSKMRAGLAEDFLIDGCPDFWAPLPDWGVTERRLPDVEFGDYVILHRGDRRVEVRHPGFVAHTSGDAAVWVPDVEVMFAGDLVFAGLTPLVVQGSVTGARDALYWLASFDPEHLVPGHGPIVARSDLPLVFGAIDRYYELIIDTASTALAGGNTPLEAAQAVDLGEFADWSDAERLVLNLHREMADQAGVLMDIVQAFVDATVYNNGPMLTHVCCLGPANSSPV